MEPVNAKLKLKMNKDKLNLTDPKISFDFLFEDISLCLNETQYREIVCTIQRFITDFKNAKYKKYRPLETGRGKKDYKNWWHYLVNAVMHDKREAKKKWSWSWMKEWIEDRKNYVRFWASKKLGREFDKELFEELEKKLSFEAICSFRELGDILYWREKKKAAETKKKSSSNFFSFAWGNSKEEQEIEITPLLMKEIYSSLKVEKQEIEKQQLFPKDYVKMKINFKINKFSAKMKECAKKSIIEVNLHDSELELQVRENSLSLFYALQNWALTDFHSSSKPLDLIFCMNKENPQIAVEFHSNPIDEHADVVIKGNFDPIEILFSPFLFDRLGLLSFLLFSKNKLFPSFLD